MKTKELIALLKKLDPEGNIEVTVGNTPIYTVDKEPAYYDGCRWELIQDSSKDPYYNIEGIKVTDKGCKISISPMELYDVLTHNINCQIIMDFENEWPYDHYKVSIDNIIKEIEGFKKVKREVGIDVI